MKSKPSSYNCHRAMKPLTIQEYCAQKARAAERRQKRRANARFIAKTNGVQLKPSRQVVIAQLDHLFSLYIRRRDRKAHYGYCVICQKRPIEVCYHLLPRSSHVIRWDETNAVGACCACNWGEKNHRLKYRQKHIELFGKERIEALEAKSRQPSDFSLGDLIAMRDEIKSKLEARQ